MSESDARDFIDVSMALSDWRREVLTRRGEHTDVEIKTERSIKATYVLKAEYNSYFRLAADQKEFEVHLTLKKCSNINRDITPNNAGYFFTNSDEPLQTGGAGELYLDDATFDTLWQNVSSLTCAQCHIDLYGFFGYDRDGVGLFDVREWVVSF